VRSSAQDNRMGRGHITNRSRTEHQSTRCHLRLRLPKVSSFSKYSVSPAFAAVKVQLTTRSELNEGNSSCSCQVYSVATFQERNVPWLYMPELESLRHVLLR
jgi:hypothetical protein